MHVVTAKRHPLKFYGALFFLVAFVVALGLLLMTIGMYSRKGDRDIALIAFSMIFFVLAAYSLYQYFKNTPIVKVDYNTISFNNKTYYWTDIAHIQLVGKQPFRYIFNTPMEGAMFVFKDGTKQYVFDDMYDNLWQAKSFIQQVVINKQSTFELPDAGAVNVATHGIYTFKGNLHTSGRGIFLWGMAGMLGTIFITTLVRPVAPAALIFVLGFATVLVLLNAWLMHFFQLSDSSLIIRNHLKPWSVTAYNYADIKEVTIETRQKMPHCMRVITKDFRNKLYPAATLRTTNWKELIDALEGYGVTVRNESIFIRRAA